MTINSILNNLGAPPATMGGLGAPHTAVDRAYETMFENYDRQTASDPYKAVDRMLDLSRGGRNPVAPLSLTRDDLEVFLDLTAHLMQRGIVGYELLEVDEQPYTSYITTRMADPKLRGAPLYRRMPETSSRLDLSA
ncbi:MAG TPA: hypothetical protein HPP77_06970 [Candidatus Hydrogenedentes bacterium]|nr:hypothetical protein [Candidatus Hydrogenedentota bacterium]